MLTVRVRHRRVCKKKRTNRRFVTFRTEQTKPRLMVPDLKSTCPDRSRVNLSNKDESTYPIFETTMPKIGLETSANFLRYSQVRHD